MPKVGMPLDKTIFGLRMPLEIGIICLDPVPRLFHDPSDIAAAMEPFEEGHFLP